MSRAGDRGASIIARGLAQLGLSIPLVALAACSALPAGPSVGSMAECGGPILGGAAIEASLCREVAETAFRASGSPQILADNVTVSELGCDVVVDRSAEAAAQGEVCYLVMGTGVSGGRRVREGVFEGGPPYDVDATVWRTADGRLHTATMATPTVMQ